MIDTTTLDNLFNTVPQCELNYPGCDGTATEHDTHPTGAALGEDGWEEVWFCGNCGWEAARES